jgi:hypothetical protein
MMVWAVVAAVTAAVHNYTGLVLVRFFLGKSFPNTVFGSVSITRYREVTA